MGLPYDVNLTPTVAPLSMDNPSLTRQDPAMVVPGPPVGKSKRVISCIHCQQRKVRCDRKYPCAPCLKSRLQCQFRAPITPRRRKKKDDGSGLHERLAKLEGILRTIGADANGDVAGNPKATSPSPMADVPSMPTPPASDTRSEFPQEEFDCMMKDLKKPNEAPPTSEFGTGKMFASHGKTLYTEKYVGTTHDDLLWS